MNQVFCRKYSEQAVSKLRKLLFLPYNALLAIQDAKNQLNSLHIYREKETLKEMQRGRSLVRKKIYDKSIAYKVQRFLALF